MCKFKQNGVCIAPNPVTCKDECGFKHETDLYNGALKELEETREKLEALELQYNLLAGQYDDLKNRHEQLLEEIRLTN